MLFYVLFDLAITIYVLNQKGEKKNETIYFNRNVKRKIWRFNYF